MSKLYYQAKDSAAKYGLWTSDGTSLGTKEVVQGTQGADRLDPFYIYSDRRRRHFQWHGSSAAANNGLWITDGTAAGSSELLSGTQGAANLFPYYLTRVNGYDIFYGGDASGKHGLWSTDGTSLPHPGDRARHAETHDLAPSSLYSLGG